MTSKQKTSVSTSSNHGTETRYLVANSEACLAAIRSTRTTGKSKAPLTNTPSEWLKFFVDSKFIGKDDPLYQSTITAMRKGTGVKEKHKAEALVTALVNAIKKFALTIEQPTCKEIQV
jgi:hypothetical protein